ncbi:2Fe-2S iron-sulfur cluster-binding protein, partial [Streptomyces synnematoformans]|uniref:2Fe-2S iron-sulfur cluster-binding protein n=1 Tax=Streptomyces synnematoformans TaxID=415721 RepID=UPI0031E2E738
MSRDRTDGEQQPQYGAGGWQPMPQGADGDPDATAFVQLPPEVFPEGDAGAPLAAPGHGYVPPPIAVPATDPGETGQFQIPDGLQGQEAQGVPEEYGPDEAYGYEQGAGPGAGRRPGGGPGAGGFGQAGMRAVAESRRGATAAGAEAYAQGAAGTEPGPGAAPYGPPRDADHDGARWSAGPAGYPADHDPGADPWPGAAAHADGGDGPYGDGSYGDVPPGPAPHPADREGPPVEGQISAWRPVRPGERTAPSWSIPTAPDDLPEDSGEYALHDRSPAAGQPDGDAREHTPPGAGHVPGWTEDGPDPDPGTDAATDAGMDAATGTDADTGAGPDTAGPEEPVPVPLSAPAPPPDEHPLASYVLRVNGADRPVTGAWIGESLLYVLRERLGLAGAKDGCSQGECGACSVKVDGRLVAACLVPAATAAGAEIRTVEGLADQGVHSDVQRALAASGAVQCGFCVPGLAMTVHDLLEGNHTPSELEARRALSGNLCRCTGYRAVPDAVQEDIDGRRVPDDGAPAAPAAAAGPATAVAAAGDAERARIPQQAAPGQGGAHPAPD